MTYGDQEGTMSAETERHKQQTAEKSTNDTLISLVITSITSTHNQRNNTELF